MAEYINREEMLKYLEENNTADEWIVGQYNADWIYSFIESQPTADVKEVKHGEWLNVLFTQRYRCSLCGNEIYFGKDKFCSECGAKMDVGSDTYAHQKKGVGRSENIHSR